MKCIIILCCEGRIDNNFRFCSGVENIILDLEKHTTSENYTTLLDYLNTVPKIFEAPCCKPNTVGNAVYKIYELGFIDESLFNRISDFYKFHMRCGLILKARPK